MPKPIKNNPIAATTMFQLDAKTIKPIHVVPQETIYDNFLPKLSGRYE